MDAAQPHHSRDLAQSASTRALGSGKKVSLGNVACSLGAGLAGRAACLKGNWSSRGACIGEIGDAWGKAREQARSNTCKNELVSLNLYGWLERRTCREWQHV